MQRPPPRRSPPTATSSLTLRSPRWPPALPTQATATGSGSPERRVMIRMQVPPKIVMTRTAELRQRAGGCLGACCVSTGGQCLCDLKLDYVLLPSAGLVYVCPLLRLSYVTSGRLMYVCPLAEKCLCGQWYLYIKSWLRLCPRTCCSL